MFLFDSGLQVGGWVCVQRREGTVWLHWQLSGLDLTASPPCLQSIAYQNHSGRCHPGKYNLFIADMMQVRYRLSEGGGG